jgi:hypothetical protein
MSLIASVKLLRDPETAICLGVRVDSCVVGEVKAGAQVLVGRRGGLC